VVGLDDAQFSVAQDVEEVEGQPGHGKDERDE